MNTVAGLLRSINSLLNILAETPFLARYLGNKFTLLYETIDEEYCYICFPLLSSSFRDDKINLLVYGQFKDVTYFCIISHIYYSSLHTTDYYMM